MMFKENHQNLSCEFAEEIVSYLYNEMVEAEKSRFETHLSNCSLCADEVADFTSVRSSILEWRNEEFAVLPTPEFEIPFETKTQNPVAAEVSRPWYIAVRDFFTLSPMWMTASTAMAVLAICVGLVFVTINALKDKPDFAQEKEKVKPVSSPTTAVNKTETTVSNSGQTNTNSTQMPTTKVDSSSTKTPATPIKIVDRQPVKPQNSNTKRNVSPNVVNKPNSSPKTKNGKLPSLTGDDEEDNSLRLSDLFDEIGTR